MTADTTHEDDLKELSEDIKAWAKGYAEENNWKLNPDEKQLSSVLKGLARNKVRLGERYCPCRLRSGDPEKDKEIICPCIYHKDEIKDDGNCHCRLFFK
ncbi:ferredoxin-thioredoxin reductase catalytic subunit [Methanomicrobium sp. W14]|uniref:ferredoxin-thioredoxin reductase catalytic domain-containing protein n=1 Tax=Methanomicrobium sp. W14 TaxID=2817839 RepID=UPI001AEB00F3|nr:ferredoxin-thioredoxin reductase catalytic domain-containing protein [Methanomicrobium sp. W14]MBP2133926.1 ferredoxin-thioredoxin reductase catalytic subunit [Methanomicrobium sp. W14]